MNLIIVSYFWLVTDLFSMENLTVSVGLYDQNSDKVFTSLFLDWFLH